jgi:membrane protease YdiL (CAAX protease family)
VRNLRLLWFPLLVSALALVSGVFVSEPASLVSGLLVVLVATFGEEVVYRGILWRALAHTGPVRVMVLTSLLSGALVLGRTGTDGPWPEAVRLTALAVLRWLHLRGAPVAHDLDLARHPGSHRLGFRRGHRDFGGPSPIPS